MRWVAISLGVALLVLGGGWLVVRRLSAQTRSARLATAPLSTRKMPGFEIDLPAGRVAESGTQYRNGRIIMHEAGGVDCSVMVGWDPGGLLDEDAIKILNEGMAAQLGEELHPISIATPIAVAEHQPTSSWAFRAGRVTHLATQVACGSRHVIVMTRSRRGDVETLHRRIAGSVRCRPDAAKERTIADVPAVFDLGPGWFRLASAEPELVLTNRRSFIWALAAQRSARSPDLVKTLTTAGVLQGISLRERVGDGWLIDGTMEGKSLRGWATTRDCPEPDQALVLMALADGDDDARKLLAGAHCRKPNEPAQTWPKLSTTSSH